MKKIAFLGIFLIVSLLVVGLSIAKGVPKIKPQCSDGLDNDGDGLVDMEDSGCGSLGDNNEVDSTSQIPPPAQPSF